MSSLGGTGVSGVRCTLLGVIEVDGRAVVKVAGTTAGTIIGEEMTRELLGRRVEYLDKSDDDDDCFFGCLALVSKW